MNPIEKFLELKQQSGLSQIKFAEKLNIKADYVKNIEAGRQKSIPDDLALALEKEYGIPFKWWKTGQGAMSVDAPVAEIKYITLKDEATGDTYVEGDLFVKGYLDVKGEVSCFKIKER